MPKTNVDPIDPTGWRRYNLAYFVLIASFLGIAILAALTIYYDRTNTMDIMTMSLPLFASWVGIILAFYYGDKNFEAANTKIGEIIKLSREERAQQPVSEIMRKFADTTTYKIPEGKDENGITLKDIREKYKGNITRLPIVGPNDSPKYIFHSSSIDKYLVDVTGSSETDTLYKFLEDRKKAGLEFGFNKGFVVVGENSTVADAKQRMDQIPFCQDVFVTKDGSEKGPIVGWISNIRLSKYLEA